MTNRPKLTIEEFLTLVGDPDIIDEDDDVEIQEIKVWCNDYNVTAVLYEGEIKNIYNIPEMKTILGMLVVGFDTEARDKINIYAAHMEVTDDTNEQ